jgi:hypothetical protein
MALRRLRGQRWKRSCVALRVTDADAAFALASGAVDPRVLALVARNGFA